MPVTSAGNDAYTATDLTLNSGDVIADQSTTDSDSLTVNVTRGTAAAGNAGAIISKIENTTFNYESATATTTAIDGITTGNVTVKQILAGGSGDATVTGAQSLTITAGSGVTGTLALTGIKAAAAVVVAAGDAAAVTATTVTTGSIAVTGASKLAAATVEGATATVTTTNAASTITAKGTAATTDTITVNAGAAVAINNDAVNFETITVSGNGAATVATIGTTAATTYTSAGTQDVTFKGNTALFTGKTITDGNGSAKTNLSIADALATSDLSKAAVDKITFTTAAAGAATLTLANAANLEFAVAPAQVVTLATKAAVAGDAVTITSVGATASLISDSTTAASETAFDTINFAANTVAVTSLTSVQTAALGAGVSTGATQTGTLNVSGTKDVTVAQESRVKTLDASALSGKLTVALNGLDDIQIIKTGAGGSAITNATAAYGNTTTHGVITGGSGADVVTLLTASYADFDGGAGTDTISLIGDVAKSTWTNVETVTLAGAITDAKLSQFSGKSVVMNGANAFAFGTTAANLDTATVDLSTLNIDNVTGITLDVSGGWKTGIASTTGLTFTGSSIKDTVTGTANVDNISTGGGDDIINATVGSDIINGGAGTGDTYAAATATQGNVINLGTTAVTAVNVFAKTGLYTADAITSVDAGKTAQLFTANAAGNTNTADSQTLSNIENVTGTAGKDYIVGSAEANVIKGGDGTDYMVGGLGADTFAFAAGDNAGANAAAVADVIGDFVVATDKIQFTGLVDVVSVEQAAVQTAVTALAAGSTDAQIATAMALANLTDLGVSIATYGGNTYVYFETTGATATHVEAANILVRLDGVTTIPTFANSFIA